MPDNYQLLADAALAGFVILVLSAAQHYFDQ
jgi:hypothetical protein